MQKTPWILALLLAAPAWGAADEPTLAVRKAAAAATAQNPDNACGPIRPFYWTVGEASRKLTGGSVSNPGQKAVKTDTVMNIASASKWLYAAYVVQKKGGVLSSDDVTLLSFRGGYTDFSTCLPGQTVGSCFEFRSNDHHVPRDDGYFFYSGGHMQKHAAVDMGLAGLDNTGLAAELQSQLGADIGLGYSQPQPAGGVVSSATQYARFLQKVLSKELLIGTLLGSNAVCTNPLTCPREAHSTPMALDETLHYSLGHWVEDDPDEGDGAFSSAGAFGFYPWIDADQRFYGVIAREGETGSGQMSMDCGRLIRAAWNDGLAR